MSKLLQNTGMNLRLSSLVGSAALLALLSAAPLAPAFAQASDQLRYLDPPQPTNTVAKLTEEKRLQMRSAYARSRKAQPQTQADAQAR
jgi:hypothetical protein